MQLTENFTLEEFEKSQTAEDNLIINVADRESSINLYRLAKFLQEIRDELEKPIRITSGYRCNTLNSLVGGAEGSNHTKGLAADIMVYGMSSSDLFDFITDMWDEGSFRVQLEECILEFDKWVHIAIAPIGHVGAEEFMIAERDEEGKVFYEHI